MDTSEQTPKLSLSEKEFENFLDDSTAIQEMYDFRLTELHLQEKQEILGFRKKWSNNLLWLVVAIVLFNGGFLIAIGRNMLSYEDEWLVRIIFTGSFIEVLGLARIVVQFLFKEEKRQDTEK